MRCRRTDCTTCKPLRLCDGEQLEQSAVFNREKTQRNGDSPLEAIVDRWVV
jgi:hypothetical protein